MKPKRQHVIPRFLLKGFASRTKDKEVYTWVYRRGGEPFEANITRIGVEKYFYGKAGELSADDDITEFEGNYAPLIEELRGIQGQGEIYDQKIPELITHLITRTKHFRDSFRESSEYLTYEIGNFLSDFDNLKPILLRHPKLMDKIKKKISDYPAPRNVRRRVQKLIKKNLPALLETQREEMQIYAEEFIETVKSAIPRAVKEGHIETLSQGLIPEPRIEKYRNLRWLIIDLVGPLILGDIGCLIETSGEKRYKSIDFRKDEVINIFLPITEKRTLIGTAYSNNYAIDLNFINKNIAKCCRDFFICSKRYPEVEALVPLIRKEAEMISKEELDRIVDDIFEKQLWK